MKTEALLTPHMIRSLGPKPKEYTVFDALSRGLGLRVHPSGAKSWIMSVRHGNVSRRLTLGSLKDLTLDEAREAFRQQKSGAPVLIPNSISFGDLARRFVEEKRSSYDPNTLYCFQCYLNAELLPAFGKRKFHQISTSDVADWFFDYSQRRPGGANQALQHFVTMYNWGIAHGHLPENAPNPAAPLRKNRRPNRGQMLNREDLARLIRTLRAAPSRTKTSANAILLMIYTGCRPGEILRLTWKAVKPRHLNLEKTKTGPRRVDLNDLAVDLLASLKPPRGRPIYVFPSPHNPSGPLTCIDTAWATFKRQCRLPTSLRLHDLRHTFASHALQSGASLYLTGQLLGHKSPHSTNRYAHLDATTLEAAAEAISREIAEMMESHW